MINNIFYDLVLRPIHQQALAKDPITIDSFMI
jgi:hypothetical protein